MHSTYRGSYGFNNRHSISHDLHNDDFLSRLEGEYWQKRINQLKYEFSNSHDWQLASHETAESYDLGAESQPASWQRSPQPLSPQPLSPTLVSAQPKDYVLRKSTVARPIVRRDRSVSPLLIHPSER